MATHRLRAVRVGRFRPVDYINLLVLVVGVLTALFIITGAVPALMVSAVLAGLGLEGILRGHPTGRLRTSVVSTLDLVTPVALLVASALLFRYVASGYWTLAASAVTALAFGMVCYATYYAQDVEPAAGGLPRIVVLAADYAGMFALLAVFYSFDLSFPAAALLTGVAAALFAVDVYRDSGVASLDHSIYALVTGVMIAQVRWAAGYVRLDGVLAATLLLVTFYVGTGMTVAALTRRLDRRAGMEFALVGLVGLAVVVVGRISTAG
jgi:hypothetical protein